MKYNEIIALLDKGFTPEYIMNMGNDSENSENSTEGDGSGQDPAEDPAEEPENAGGDVAAQIAAAMAPFVKEMSNIKKELQAGNILRSQQATSGLWIVYALVPVIGMIISTVFYLFYKLRDRDVQIMAACNAGKITREEAEQRLSRKY